jgi:deoxyribonuclease-4
MSKPLIGAHVSIAGGVPNAWQNLAAISADCIQIFTANQRQWQPKPISAEDLSAYQAARQKSPNVKVMCHNSYLVNLCSPDEAVQEKSLQAFKEEIQRCKALGVDLLNFHPGSHKEQSLEWGIETIARNLDSVRDLYRGSGLKLVLEATAGQGTNIGWQFEQLAAIIEQMDDTADVGVCIDTCHIFAAGYDIRDQKSWDETWKQFDEIIGFERLLGFHVNDSKFDLGTRKDRHEEIGKGHIGLEAFRLLVNDERFNGLPMILETPCGPPGYAEEIALLKSLIGKTAL